MSYPVLISIQLSKKGKHILLFWSSFRFHLSSLQSNCLVHNQRNQFSKQIFRLLKHCQDRMVPRTKLFQHLRYHLFQETNTKTHLRSLSHLLLLPLPSTFLPNPSHHMPYRQLYSILRDNILATKLQRHFHNPLNFLTYLHFHIILVHIIPHFNPQCQLALLSCNNHYRQV